MYLFFQVTGFMTQGRGDGLAWVSSYLVSYSSDGTGWNYVMDSHGNGRVGALEWFRMIAFLSVLLAPGFYGATPPDNKEIFQIALHSSVVKELSANNVRLCKPNLTF